MNESQMMDFCLENRNLLKPGMLKFLNEIKVRFRKGGGLTDGMYQYLQGCYDHVVAKKYNLTEDMAPDEDFFAKKATLKLREKYFK